MSDAESLRKESIELPTFLFRLKISATAIGIYGYLIEVKKYYPNVQQDSYCILSDCSISDLEQGHKFIDELLEHKLITATTSTENPENKYEDIRITDPINALPQKFVYLIRDKVSGYIKIGYSTNPHNRIDQLKPKTLLPSNVQLELIGFWMGDETDEVSLHGIFRNRRVNGEWFDLDDKDIQYIRETFEQYPVRFRLEEVIERANRKR